MKVFFRPSNLLIQNRRLRSKVPLNITTSIWGFLWKSQISHTCLFSHIFCIISIKGTSDFSCYRQIIFLETVNNCLVMVYFTLDAEKLKKWDAVDEVCCGWSVVWMKCGVDEVCCGWSVLWMKCAVNDWELTARNQAMK